MVTRKRKSTESDETSSKSSKRDENQEEVNQSEETLGSTGQITTSLRIKDMARVGSDNGIVPPEEGEISDDDDANNAQFLNIEIEAEEMTFEERRELVTVSDSPLRVIQDDDVVDLSGDEDEDWGGCHDEDVTLVCLKRPLPVVSNNKHVECVDILDSDEEFPVCVQPAQQVDTVNIEEKTGYIKEYIENEGLGVVHSPEHGLVLFHLHNVWINGEKMEPMESRSNLRIGTQVSYYEKAFEGPEYKVLCKDEVICQAVVLWKGLRPKHLMKQIDSFSQEHWNKLDDHRKTFLLYVRGEVFTPMAFCRVRGVVEGYLNDDIGLIKVEDDKKNVETVFFTSQDVIIYKRGIGVDGLDVPVYEAMPVGLHVYVDAKRCHILRGCELKYQAVTVFAGTWPRVPHPTLLPGGNGTYAPKFDLPEDRDKSTFYYMELGLEPRLQKKVNQVKYLLEETRGLKLEWAGVRTINSKVDLEAWKEYFDPLYGRRNPRPRNNRRHEKMEVTHTFKPPLIRHFKTKREMYAGSVDGNVGSTRANLSEAGSVFGSRADSRMSEYSNNSWPSDVESKYSASTSRTTSRTVSRTGSNASGVTRTWYNPDLFSIGGLRLKKELKTEFDPDNAFSSTPRKIFKSELH